MDLNGDGHIDLLSGSWPGELFFFQGGPNRTFAPPVKLKNKEGKTINVGGGIQKDTDDELLIAGDVKWEKSDKGGWVLVYEGQRIEVPEGKQAAMTGTASAVHAADWDGDGDFDLLVGNIQGGVYLVPNEGSATHYAFGKEQQLEAEGQPIQVPHGDAGPFAADWDGDGKLDLLVGAGDGSVTLFRNVGSAKQPKLAKGETLVPAVESTFWSDPPKEPQRGLRTKVCAADWNGDGRLDLLVGDFTKQKPDLPQPSPEEKAQHDKLRRELAELQKQYSEMVAKLHGPGRVKDKAEQEKLEKEFTATLTRMREIRGKLPPEYEYHGWVWLFQRK